jgi:Tol biopolymer transport system component
MAELQLDPKKTALVLIDLQSAAWSPDGQQIVFTSDMAGRPNLWKVNAKGGWPIQLTQSDDRQVLQGTRSAGTGL